MTMTEKDTEPNLPAGIQVVRLPKMGKLMEEATIVAMAVKVGDKVTRGDVLFEIETDKTSLEMESPYDGYVRAFLVENEQTIPIHTPMALIGGKDIDIREEFIESLKEKGPDPFLKAEPKSVKPEPDIVHLPESVSIEYKLGATVPLTRMQKITGEKMLKSKREIPCFYLTVEVDLTELVEHREQLNRGSDTKIAYNDFIIRAVAMGLERFELMTGQVQDNEIRLAESIDIGLAMAVPGGLVAPIVKNASGKTLEQIAGEIQRLIERARDNKLGPDELSGGCITISNLGAYGIESFIPIVVPGQCSILGIGKISDTVVPEKPEMAVRKKMKMTISVDHRVANGSYAAQFIDHVRKVLEDPKSIK